MADKIDDDTKVEEPVIQEESELEVVLDKEPDVQGDLIENPIIEEVEEDDSESNADAGTEEIAEETEQENVAEEASEIEVEEDNTGVYSPPTVDDPGEFKPQDHSFTITIDGTKHKITSIEQADNLVDQITDSKQLIRFMDKRSDMRSAIQHDQEIWQADREKFDLEQTQAKVRDDQVSQWNNEVNYLESKGLIPKIDAAKNRDWLGNKEDSAVAERLAIFDWMDNENKARQAAGIPEVTSAVDAFRMMRAEQMESSANQANSKDGDMRRKRGDMISDNAPFSPSNQPKGSIIGEGGSLKDLVLEAGSGY